MPRSYLFPGNRQERQLGQLERQLVSVSQRSTPKAEFSVVREWTMLRAMRARGFTIKDLGDAKKVQALAKEAGLDAIVSLLWCRNCADLFRPTLETPGF